MRTLNYILLGFMVLFLLFYAGFESNPYQELTGKTMGTYYIVKIQTNKKDNFLNNEIKTLLDKIVQSQSVFDTNSELSKINEDTSGEWIDLSPMMTDVMKKAHNIYILTGGAFDPTVGKLVDLWGFGVAKLNTPPTQEEIDDTLEYTGFDKILFSDDFTKLKKTHPKIYINLSAIAKGYGVDKVAELLDSKGYKDYIIEIGGEVRAKGNNSKSNGWSLGVKKPTNKNENVFVVILNDMSAATSGDYRNYNIINEEKFSHTIDPKTGYPIKNNISSVTVFSQNCMDADAYATATMTLGDKKGLEFANNHKLSVLIFVKNVDNNFEVLFSNSASKLISKE